MFLLLIIKSDYLKYLFNENCSLKDIKLNEITKKFPKLNANIMGVIREDKFVVLKKTDIMLLNDNAICSRK